MIDFPVVSPLRQPETQAPRHPDQITMFESPVDTTFAADGQGSSVTFTVRFHRTPRQKCSACGKRRVCFHIGLGDLFKGPSMCAHCFGIR
jgi:hypothetical protein